MSITDKALWVMERNSERSLTLNTIASACGVSRSHMAPGAATPDRAGCGARGGPVRAVFVRDDDPDPGAMAALHVLLRHRRRQARPDTARREPGRGRGRPVSLYVRGRSRPLRRQPEGTREA